jgi:hypothetical protein
LTNELTDEIDKIKSSRKYERPTTTTTSTLATPMIIARGNKALCKRLLPEGDTGVRKGLNEGVL